MNILNFVKKVFQGRYVNVNIAEVVPFNEMYLAIGTISYFNSFIATMTKDYVIEKFVDIDDNIIVNRVSVCGDLIYVSGTKWIGLNSPILSIPVVLLFNGELERIKKRIFNPTDDIVKEKIEDVYFEDIYAISKYVYLTCRMLFDFSKSIVVRYSNTLDQAEVSGLIDMGVEVNYTKFDSQNKADPKLLGWVLEKSEEDTFPIPKKKFEIQISGLFESHESLISEPGRLTC